VSDALTGRRFVSEALRAWRAAGRLAGHEAALALEIGQGTLRHIVTIEHVLGKVARVERARMPARLRAVLATAAYQVIWLERIPVFAAVDEAVELARRLVRGRAPGMANAVLRRLAGAITERRVPWRRLDPTHVRVNWEQACAFSRPVLPEPTGEAGRCAHLAAATGERRPRFAELVARHGPERAEAAAWPRRRATDGTAREHTAVVERGARAALRAAHGDAVRVVGDTAFVPPAVAGGATPPFAEGRGFVQDPTAYAAAQAVAASPGERVLDLCAAPGGKSIVLALAMNDRGEVVACDTAPERLERVAENVARLGLRCVQRRVVSHSGAELNAEHGRFDAALVDVPCSNTGVIARRPEARLGLTRRKLESLCEVQAALLRQAAACVRPGGRLVYSTCSIEPEENEQMVAAFLRDNPDWRLDEQVTTLPAAGPQWSDWHDGGYYARLVRAAR
jgi:16S rRNA (cytosine967-C5)-methyltransferase